MENYNDNKLERATKKVEKVKGFYIHLTVYICVNLFIMGNILYNSGWNDFLDFGTFFTPFFWGIGLFAHYSKTFGYLPFFGKDWEQRKIQKYIKRDRDDSEKFMKK